MAIVSWLTRNTSEVRQMRDWGIERRISRSALRAPTHRHRRGVVEILFRSVVAHHPKLALNTASSIDSTMR